MARRSAVEVDAKPSVCFVAQSAPMIRALLGTGPAEAGGSQLQFALLGGELHKRGWPVRFVVGDFGQGPRAMANGSIELIASYGTTRLPRGLRFIMHRVPRMWQALRTAAADVYICQGVGWESGLVAAFCRLRGAKCIIRMGSAADPLFADDAVSFIPRKDRWLSAYAFRRANVITAQTQEQLALLRARLSREGVLLPNVWPVPDQVIAPNGEPQALWAGRIEGIKRPHLLVDVAERLEDVRFIIAGGRGTLGGDCFDAVQVRAEAMANVLFRGFVPPEEIDAEYVAASVLISTSQIEGFPNTFLQAWGHARPVVSTYDPDEVICRHQIGFHCHTADEIAEKVRCLCRDTTLRDSMGARARRYIRDHHDPSVVMPKLEDLLRGLLKTGPKAHDCLHPERPTTRQART